MTPPPADTGVARGDTVILTLQLRVELAYPRATLSFYTIILHCYSTLLFYTVILHCYSTLSFYTVILHCH
jgi:hypothetical protein